ncbi:DUF3047 domain-containing protein [Pseudorhodoferax sp. Leaf274]|uniref:DUF3047 domain-containing protein n=1 Tax=Pseudorhodoferax sp. Leaf274 TaxID=1736318 RepID=UPI001F23C817|nr:DUF3047 domain-containing protein [Pseudorhodoferax sp. Leaf274]
MAAAPVAPVAQTPWGKVSLQQLDGVPWQHLPLPGKRATQFDAVQVDGRAAMAVTADASASMLRKQVHVPASALGQLSFSWKVPALIPGADMAARDADDAPVRLVLAFEGDRSRFSAKNAMLSELARALTGEEMPYATLMYVWCNTRAPGSVILNPRTDRIRKIVVESGPGGLGQWRDYARDVHADFVRAFGEEPGALVAVGIMTDSDNTSSHVQAWYGPLDLRTRMPPAP